MVKLISVPCSMDERIANTLDYINAHLDEPLDLKRLAKVACLSPSQFHRVFKKAVQKTPFQYIEAMKMSKAHELIIQGKSSIHELTTLLGYKDYETFSRAFKRAYTISPDDIKAIVNTLKGHLQLCPESGILVVAVEKKRESELMEKIKAVLESRTISMEDLAASKIFTINLKSSEHAQTQLVVKNKFELTEDSTIIKSLL